VISHYFCSTLQELARLNAELAKEREKLETLASDLSDEYENIKQYVRNAKFRPYIYIVD